VKVNGETVYAVIDDMGAFKQVAPKILAEHAASVRRSDYLFLPRSAQHWNRDNRPHPETWNLPLAGQAL
jgi:hypothetical protein